METEFKNFELKPTTYCIIWTDVEFNIDFHYCSALTQEKALLDFFRNTYAGDVEGYEITRTDEKYLTGDEI